MNPAPRWCLCLAVAVGTLVNVCSTYRDWAARADLDLAALPELEGQIARVERDLAERDSELQVWAGLEQERNQITGAVIDGRMGLFEAATRFRDINAVSPDGGRMVRAKYPGSYDEQCCQQVISWVNARLALASPATCAKVTAELEAELRERQSREGTVHLPE